jgi:hypothetical protein
MNEAIQNAAGALIDLTAPQNVAAQPDQSEGSLDEE